jgi:hypothetical protein
LNIDCSKKEGMTFSGDLNDISLLCMEVDKPWFKLSNSELEIAEKDAVEKFKLNKGNFYPDDNQFIILTDKVKIRFSSYFCTETSIYIYCPEIELLELSSSS